MIAAAKRAAPSSWLPQVISYLRTYWLQEKLLRPRIQRLRIPLPDRDGTGYLGEMQEFLGSVAEERLPVTPPEDALRDLEIILRAYEALGQEGMG